VHPPPSPAQANFTLMTESTPESRRYYSEYSVVLSVSRSWNPFSVEVCMKIEVLYTLIKQKIKFSSYIRKFRVEQLQLTASSYMTLQLLHFALPYIGGKFYFLFYQCIYSRTALPPRGNGMKVKFHVWSTRTPRPPV
jgi:hypothetical protein